jgi:Fe-S-cluster-containing hydrogenase component 2
MDAFRMEDSKVSLEKERCIGCGLCVTTCPTGALRLQRKPEPLQKKIPRTWIEALYTLAKKRGKLGPIKVLKIKARTSFDRFRAARSRARQ